MHRISFRSSAFLLIFSIGTAIAAADDRSVCFNRVTTAASVAACTRLIESYPNDEGSYVWRAHHLRNMGEYDRAIADTNEAIKLNPADAPPYNIRGFAYEAKGDYDRAMTDYNEAIRLNPNYAIAYSNRGSIYYQRHDYDRAITDFGEAIRHDSKYAVAYYDRGRSYEMKGEYDKALADFRAALAIDPQYREAREEAAAIAQRLAARGMPKAAGPPATAKMGAVAVGACDRLGYALGYDNLDAANAAALQACGSDGDRSCKVILSINGDCAAFAVAGTCGPRGWANGADRQQAEARAMVGCASHGGQGCTLRRSICNGEN